MEICQPNLLHMASVAVNSIQSSMDLCDETVLLRILGTQEFNCPISELCDISGVKEDVLCQAGAGWDRAGTVW